MEKLTIRPAAPWSTERRAMWFISPLLGGAQHGRDHAHMAAAAAEISRQSGADIRLAGARVAAQQRGRRHDHAIGAITALRRGLGDEGGLDLAGRFGAA